MPHSLPPPQNRPPSPQGALFRNILAPCPMDGVEAGPGKPAPEAQGFHLAGLVEQQSRQLWAQLVLLAGVGKGAVLSPTADTAWVGSESPELESKPACPHTAYNSLLSTMGVFLPPSLLS